MMTDNSSPNPYQSPAAAPLPQRPVTLLYLAPDPRIAWRLRIPAVILMLLSGIQLVPFLPLLLSAGMATIDWIWTGFRHFPTHGSDPEVAIAYFLISLVTLLIFAGAYEMNRLRNWQLCRVAAVCACIPVLSPWLIVGIPFGIWAVIVLNMPSTAAEFLRIKDPLPADEDAPNLE